MVGTLACGTCKLTGCVSGGPRTGGPGSPFCRNRFALPSEEDPGNPTRRQSERPNLHIHGSGNLSWFGDWLNAFYNDWATTLRSELSYHQAVRIGISEVKGGRKPAEEPPVTPEDDTK